jgi:RimJ/RimL family protein N-acetyltransferase
LRVLRVLKHFRKYYYFTQREEFIVKNKSSDKTDIRSVVKSDLFIFFENQLDEESNYMAAFTAEDPSDKEAFDEKWKKIMTDESITIRTIVFNDAVAGHVVCHSWFGYPEVSYWIGRQYWGKGIATRALTLLLEELKERPLFARVAEDNAGSKRVLEKCGFIVSGRDEGYSNARGEVVDEIIYKID